MGKHKFSYSKIFLYLIMPLFVGCTTASLTVNSVPEKAQVLIRPVGGGELVSMGETPLVLTRAQLKSNGADSGPVLVEVQKENFISQKILITESDAVDMKLDFALALSDKEQGLTGPGYTLGDAQDLNSAIDRLFEVRKFINLESYGEALIHLRNIESKWPFLSAVYEMKGGVLFLQKKYRDALAAYGIALKYNPKSVSSANMASTLEAKLGIDADKLVNEYEKKRLPAGKIKKKKSSKKKRKSKSRRKRKKKK